MVHFKMTQKDILQTSLTLVLYAVCVRSMCLGVASNQMHVFNHDRTYVSSLVFSVCLYSGVFLIINKCMCSGVSRCVSYLYSPLSELQPRG